MEKMDFLPPTSFLSARLTWPIVIMKLKTHIDGKTAMAVI